MGSSENGILRDLQIYCAVAGVTNTQFPKHEWAVRLVAVNGDLVWANDKEPPLGEDGTNNETFYKGVLWALPRLRTGILDRLTPWLRQANPDAEAVAAELYAPRTLTIISPKGSELHRVFSQTVEDRERNHYRSRDGKPWKNHQWIRQVDKEAAELKLLVTCREAREDAELELTYSTRDLARQRWEDAKEAVGKEFP